MTHAKRLTCTPEIDRLVEAPERASLSLLAAAAQCAKNALLAEHRAELQAMCCDHADPTPAVTIVATQVIDRINDLMEALPLHEAVLRDHVQAGLYQDLPF